MQSAPLLWQVTRLSTYCVPGLSLWSVLFTLELLRSPWPLGMVLSAPEKPFPRSALCSWVSSWGFVKVRRARGSE